MWKRRQEMQLMAFDEWDGVHHSEMGAAFITIIKAENGQKVFLIGG
jgi:hypothetical protein